MVCRILLSILFSFGPFIEVAWATAANTYLPIQNYGFSSDHSFATNRASKYDSEVESDNLTYKQVGCLTNSVLSDEGDDFCASAGSLSGKRFLIDSYMLVSKQLNDNIDFRFQWNKEQDFFYEKDNLSFEFLGKLNNHHAIGVLGMVDSQKAEDDVGLSYNYFNEDKMHFRLQATAYDFSRNDRNEYTDNFQEKPYVFSASLLNKSANKEFYISIFIEPKFIWQNIAGEIVSRRTEGVSGAYRSGKNLFTYEYLSDSTRNNQQHEAIDTYQVQWLADYYEFTYGLRFVQRNFQAENQENTFYNLLPFTWFQPPNWDRFKVGYEMTWQISEEIKDTTEHRLNIAWSAINSEAAIFDFIFSFDMDRFAKSDMWEGGFGRLAYSF